MARDPPSFLCWQRGLTPQETPQARSSISPGHGFSVKRASGGTLAEQGTAQGVRADCGQTTALGRGGTHAAGARHPQLAPKTRQMKSKGLKSTVPALPAEPEQHLPLPSVPFSTAPRLHLVNKSYNKLHGLGTAWVGDPRPQLFPHRWPPLLQGSRNSPPTGNVVGAQLPGPTANPFEQLHNNQTELLPLKFNGSDRVLPGGVEEQKEMERKDIVPSKVR